MADFDLGKFTKLMMMATSSHDHEALVALRMANSMLAAVDRNWEELLKGKVVVQGDWESKARDRTRHVDSKEIDTMFRHLLYSVPLHSSFRMFIEDVHQWWLARGFLTSAQYAALKRAMERTRT
jgi:hypothetical protein